jgi:phospholipid/cholesterol/gamma-HCH transport system substrate-binding protein
VVRFPLSMKISKEVKIGFVFVVATAVLIWGIMFLKGMEIFRSRKIYYAVYEKINGLVPANPVSINGMKVGQVKSIYFHPKDPRKIVVVLYLSNPYNIPKNSVAKIISADLMGSKEIVLDLGDSKEFLKDGDTIRAVTEASLGEEVNRQLAPLKHKAENLISSIDSIAITLQQVLNENTRDNLVQAIDHVKQALESAAHMAMNMDTLVSDERNNLARIISNVESISSNLKRDNDKIHNIISNLSNVSDSLAKARIPATIAEINTAVSDLDRILTRINNGEGTIGLLVRDEQLYKEVTKAAKDLNLLLEDIKANPKKYVKVSVF